MGGGELHPDPGPVLRDHGVGEGGDEHALLEHRVGDLRGEGRVPEHHRHDRVLAGQQLEALLAHPSTEQLGVAEQGRPQLAAALDQLERGEGGGHDRRGQRVREEVGAALLPQHRHDLAAGGDIAAAGTAERLAEGAGIDVHALGDPEVLRGAGAGGTHEAHGVGVIDHHQRTELLGEVADALQRGEVAVHGEDAVGDDDGAAGASSPRAGPRPLRAGCEGPRGPHCGSGSGRPWTGGSRR